MKKSLFLLLFLVGFNLYSKTTEKSSEIEINSFTSLCNYGLENNINIKSKKIDYIASQKEVTGSYLSYIPKFNIVGGIEYSENEKIDLYKPENFFGQIDIIQNIPGIGELEIIPLYKRIKTTSKKNNDNPYSYFNYYDLSVNFTQSIVPYWYGFNFHNPKTYIPKNNRLLRELDLLSEEFNFLKSVITIMNDIKQCYYCIEILEKKLVLYNKIYDSYMNLYNNQNGNSNSLFSTLEKISSTKKELDEIIRKKDSNIISLKHSINFTKDTKDFENIIKKCITEENWYEDFKKEFNYWNYDYICEIEVNKIMLNKEIEYSEYLLERQNLAPQFYLKGNVNYSKETNHNFEVQIGFDFSPLVDSKKVSYKYEHKEKCNLLEEQIETLKQNNIEEKKSYEEVLSNKTKEYSLMSKDLENRKKIFSDYNFLYNEKKCSEIELLQSELSFMEFKFELNELENDINFYKLLLSKDY